MAQYNVWMILSVSDISDAVCHTLLLTHTILLTHGYVDKLLICHVTPYVDPDR